jgi:hypothetical protein
MEYTTALSTISVLPDNKKQVAIFSRKLKDEILANDKDPLQILVKLKFIEKLIADILKDEEIDLHFLKEFELYEKEKIIEVNGAKLSQGEVGVKYFYEESGDPVWNDISGKINELTEKKKEREKFLQNIPYDKGTVDPDTGVFITRPPKISKTKVICRL